MAYVYLSCLVTLPVIAMVAWRIPSSFLLKPIVAVIALIVSILLIFKTL